MTINNGHDLFTLSPALVHHGLPVMVATCTCGESSPRATPENTVRWFGAHCYNAALDRALEILKS